MNNNVIEFLENYIGLRNNPEYAVMIKGEWGCGKTWFIKNFINKIIEDKTLEKKEIIYISVYGIQNIEQLEMEFVKAVHPILNSIVDSTVFSIGNAVAKGVVSGELDIQKDAKNIVKNLFVKRKFFRNRLKETDLIKRLIIIDDLERSNLEPNVILGYLSNLIIDSGIRVIIVANEEEYININSQFKESYLKTREKMIAYRFEIKPNLNDAIKDFLNQIDLKDEKYYEIVSNVINKLEIKNLRIIRQALINYQYIISKIKKELLDKYIEYKYKIFEVNIILFTQFALGDLCNNEENSIERALKYYYGYNTSLRNFNENNNKDDNMYSSIYLGKIPLNKCWKDIIFNGIFDANKINKNIEEDNVVVVINKNKDRNIYHILNNFYSLSSYEFKETIKKIEKDFESGVYKNIGDILHIYNTFSLFSREGIIEKDEKEFYNWFDEVIEKNRNLLVGYKMDLDFGYNGYAYNETEKFNEIKERLVHIAEQNYYKEIANEVIKNIDTEFDLETFIENLSWKNSSKNEPKYYEIPILSMISIDKLFDKLINDTIKNQNLFLYALKNRYGVSYSNGTLDKKYIDEFKAIEDIYSLYKEYLEGNNFLYNPNIIRYKYFIQEYENIIKYMKEEISKL